MKPLIQLIDACLPQTQCTQCGYQGCLPYAEAMAKGAAHNQCPPGGASVIAKLSAVLQREILPLNPSHGQEKPKYVAKIREADCIGCTKCIQACPTDAILGAAKLMHSVIEDECTGCGLCVSPCPMNCIDMHEAPLELQPTYMSDAARTAQANHYRQRHQLRNARLARLENAQTAQHQLLKTAGKPASDDSLAAKKAYIAEALARVQLKKQKP